MITSRPSSSSTNYSKHLPQSSQLADDFSETESVLQKHYIRVQQTLMSAIDRKVGSFETKTAEQESLLKKVNSDKEMLGAELYDTKIQVGRLNDALSKINTKLAKAEDSKKLVAVELSSVEREVVGIKDDKKALQLTIGDYSGRLQEALIKIQQLTDINNAYTSDIKIQKHIHNKLKRDLEVSENKRKEADAQLDVERRKIEKLIQDKKEVEQLVVSQKHETFRAQAALDKMNHELNSLNESNCMLKKKWDDALGAMGKRDETLQTVQDAQSKLRSQLSDTESKLRSSKLEKEDVEKRLFSKEIETQNLSSQILALKNQISQMENRTKDSRSGAQEVQAAETMYRQEIKKITKETQNAQEELHRKTVVISDLKSKIHLMKEEFDAKMKHDFIVQIAKKEESLKESTESQIQVAVRMHERDNTNIRHENAQLKLQIRELEEKLVNAVDSKSKIQYRYDEVHSHYVKLYEEAKHLIYALERKEHDINYLKSKVMENNENDKTRSLQMSILRLQKEVSAAKIANDRLQTMWLESQKENLKTKEVIQTLTAESTFLKTQLGITDVIKSKTLQQTGEAKKEGIESKFEAAKLYSELKKLQPIIDELREKNAVLERQLIESRLQVEEVQLNDTTTTHMLKAEIRRLNQDRASVMKSRLTDEKSSSVLERKYLMTKEMLEKMKAERHELQKSCFEMKCRAEDMEKRYKELKSQYKHFADVARRHSQAGSSHSQKAAWASLSSTPGGTLSRNGEPVPSPFVKGEDVSMNEPESDQIPDFEAWRLRLGSLTTERDFLKSENDALKRRLESTENKNNSLERYKSDTSSRLKSSDVMTKNAQQQLESIQIRCKRAEKLAAYIEKQFKDAKPNTKIDYQLVSNVEISTQLLAALMVKDMEDE